MFPENEVLCGPNMYLYVCGHRREALDAYGDVMNIVEYLPDRDGIESPMGLGRIFIRREGSSKRITGLGSGFQRHHFAPERAREREENMRRGGVFQILQELNEVISPEPISR